MQFTPPLFKGYVIVIFFSLLGAEITRWILTNIVGVPWESEFGPYLVFVKMLGLTVMGWFYAHVISIVLAKKFFELFRLSLLHQIPSLKKISYKDIFLTLDKKSKILQFVLTFFACHAFSTLIALLIVMPLQNLMGTDFELQLLLMVGAVSPITATIVFPILVLYSSDIRIFLRKKKIISSSFSPFKYLIFSIFGISTFFSAIITLDIAKDSMMILYFTWLPSMILAILFSGSSIKPLTADFRKYLVSIGIKKGKVDVN